MLVHDKYMSNIFRGIGRSAFALHATNLQLLVQVALDVADRGAEIVFMRRCRLQGLRTLSVILFVPSGPSRQQRGVTAWSTDSGLLHYHVETEPYATPQQTRIVSYSPCLLQESRRVLRRFRKLHRFQHSPTHYE
jgi:hypothetical protein